jgi:hypothetical protein
MSRYGVLVAKIENELKRLEQSAHAAQTQTAKAKRTGDEDYLQAAALSLQNFYMGVERIFEEIAKQVDESLPTGANSHLALLEQMSLEIPDVRLPVIQSETLEQLNAYRGFRHVVIHRYGFELYPERVEALVDQLATCLPLLVHNVQGFCQFLLQVDRAL